MSRRLLIIEGDDKGHFSLSVEAGTVTIGGSSGKPEVILRDLHVSRIRCEVEVAEELVVAGKPATADGASGARHELRPGEAVQIGQARLSLAAVAGGDPGSVAPLSDVESPGFADEEPAAATPPHVSASAPPAPAVPTAISGQGRMVKRLHVFDGADQGRFFLLPDTGLRSIGKSRAHADIILHDLYVARLHCELQIDGEHIMVTHVEGQNGTLINGQQIKQQEMRLGDVLRVGNSHLRLEVGVAEAADAPKPKADSSAVGLAADDGSTEAVLEDVEIVEEEADDAEKKVEKVEEKVEEVQEVEEEVAAKAEEVEEVPAGIPLPETGDPFCLPHAPIDQLLKLEDQILGNYQIGPLLGRGQSGLVFRAQETSKNRPVALKVLSPDFPQSAAELQHFVRALKVIPQLKHAHLVSLYGAGKTGHYCWIAREYVEGDSLAQVIRHVHEEGKSSWVRACRVAVHMGKVLHFLNQHKVNHGNLLPRNVLIANHTRITKLADLMLDEALQGSHLYKAIKNKKLLAELHYRAPEQTVDKVKSDHRTDLYMLGSLLYGLLTGQPPFTGNSPKEVLAHIKEAKVVKPSKLQHGVPPAFEAVVLKLMARRPEDRYQTAAELLADVEPIATAAEIKV